MGSGRAQRSEVCAMSPMLSSSTNLDLFKTIVLNFKWFCHRLMAVGSGAQEVMAPAARAPGRCEPDGQVAVLIRCAAMRCEPRMRRCRCRCRRGDAGRAAACSLHSRASECCAVGSSAVGAAVPQPEGIEVAMQHAAVRAWRGARGIKKAAPGRQSQRAECSASSTIEPIGRHASCNCPLCSSPRLSALARSRYPGIAGVGWSAWTTHQQTAAAHPR